MMSLTDTETKDARAQLRAKHGKAAAMTTQLSDEQGGWIIISHPTQESATDYCDLSVQMGWTDSHAIQTRDGGWANVYRWRYDDLDPA